MSTTQSPLHDRHVQLDAKFSEFGGWTMPQEYGAGVVKEHTVVRESVGIFDVSHLGKMEVAGPGAAAHVDATLSNDLAKIRPGKAQYTLVCNDEGGIVDDLIIYFRDDENVLLMPNAGNAAEVARMLRADAPDGVEIRDRHQELAAIAVQGPRSDEVLQEVGLPTDHEFMSFADADFSHDGGSTSVVVCRSGYTGERGCELLVAAEDAGAVWDALLAAGQEHGGLPCGLGARDTLRTEVGLPLHGQDLSADINPVEAGLSWAVGWKKESFWGRDALLRIKEEGPTRRMRGLLAAGRGIPRPGMAVHADASDIGGEPLCEITSGTFSPTLRKGIGLALVPTTVDKDATVVVDVRGRAQEFQLTRPPFVQSPPKES